MEQSPWEADSHSISQQIPRLLSISKFNYRVSQEPATGPYSEPDESNSHLYILFKMIPIFYQLRRSIQSNIS